MSKNLNDVEFKAFVDEYLNRADSSRYDASKLRTDLRNKLVHNYSLGETYGLVMGYPNMHLKRFDDGLLCLNLENFKNDLEDAFYLYISEVRSNKDNLKQLALDAYGKVKISD